MPTFQITAEENTNDGKDPLMISGRTGSDINSTITKIEKKEAIQTNAVQQNNLGVENAYEIRDEPKISAQNGSLEKFGKKERNEGHKKLENVYNAEDKQKFYCDKCDSNYTTKRSLIRHNISKHEGKRHKCIGCMKTFGYTHDLKIHYQRKHGQSPFACKKCRKGYTRQDRLRKHENKNRCKDFNTQVIRGI